MCEIYDGKRNTKTGGRTDLGTIEQGVLHLNAGELGPSIELGNIVHFDELPCPNVRGTDVSDLSGKDEVMEGAHGLLKRRIGVVHVNDEDVNVVCAEPLQAGLGLVEYGCTGEANLVDVVPSVLKFRTHITRDGGHLLMVDEEPDLRDDDEILPRDIVLRNNWRMSIGKSEASDLVDKFAENSLGLSVATRSRRRPFR